MKKWLEGIILMIVWFFRFKLVDWNTWKSLSVLQKKSLPDNNANALHTYIISINEVNSLAIRIVAHFHSIAFIRAHF
jgi:hypothetical protein